MPPTDHSSAARLMVWQALDEFPGTVFAPVRSGLAHAIVERLETPATWVTTACGHSGFVAEEVAEVEEERP